MNRLFGVLLAASLCAAGASVASAQVEITAVDKASGKRVAARMHLKTDLGKIVVPPKTVSWRDHFVFNGTVRLDLPPDDYTFEVECGPEYKVRYGEFTIRRGAKDSHSVQMERFVNMKQEGWWSGELHIHRPVEDIELLMRAEDLHVAPLITWWNKRNAWSDKKLPEQRVVRFDGDRFYHVMAGEDERGGGAVLYFNLDEPLPIASAEREFPSSAEFVEMSSRYANAHVDVEKPFWWDVPVWLASGKVHSIGLAHNHMWRDGVLGNEAWGKARDTTFYPGVHGNARWSQDIYYRILDCGLRIPPSAGSASGVLSNPVGYNRAYVFCGEDFSYENWFAGLRAGRVVVTNGPMLRPRVNGQPPGHVFSAPSGQTVELDIVLDLSLRDKVEYLEVVQNGRVVHSVRLEDYVKQQGRLAKLVFQDSGWMLIRAVANHQKTFRFASTGPYYVEIGGKPRISREAAQFFRDWVDERIKRIRLNDPQQQEKAISFQRTAREFWNGRVEAANAE